MKNLTGVTASNTLADEAGVVIKILELVRVVSGGSDVVKPRDVILSERDVLDGRPRDLSGNASQRHSEDENFGKCSPPYHGREPRATRWFVPGGWEEGQSIRQSISTA